MEEKIVSGAGKRILTWICGGILGLGVIGGGYYYYTNYYIAANKTEGGSSSARTNCSNIDTTNWPTYNKQGFTIKYPSGWVYKEIQAGAGGTQWFVKFGPNNNSLLVFIGGSATTLAEFKQYLTAQSSPAYTIIKEESATIDSRTGTKLTVSGGGFAYKSIIYHIPFMNVPYIFQGPADSGSWSKCEPQKYLNMLNTFKFPALPGQDASSSWKTYTNTDCKFSFEYPTNWEVKEDYYYETAGGSKALIPSIIIGKASNSDSAHTDMIMINLRQTFCSSELAASKKTETAGAVQATIYTMPDNSYCAEAEVAVGKDKTGKMVGYNVVSRYDDSLVKDIFKHLLSSFSQQ